MSMPGTPVIYYGDEIGMGDNIYLGDRDGVRTPMQWSPDRNGGFSRANPQRLFLPAIQDPIYGFEAVNVEAQQQSPGSLLNWMKRLIAVRQGRTHLRPRHPDLPLSRQPQDPGLPARARGRDDPLRLQPLAQRPGGRPRPHRLPAAASRSSCSAAPAFPPVADPSYRLTLPGYGFFWFLLAEVGPARGRRRRDARAASRLHHRGADRTAGAASPRVASAATSAARPCRPSCRSSAGSRPRTARSARSSSRRRASCVAGRASIS